jgi:putative acetyltransferase
MPRYVIQPDDLRSAEVIALLEYHMAEMHRWSPPGAVHALPVARLREADVTFFSAFDGGRLAAVGAIRALDETRGELKSMRADPAYRGQGAGQAILVALIGEARRRGCRWVGLETGRAEAFHPALALYRKHGFSECAPFGNYEANGFSLCMERFL